MELNTVAIRASHGYENERKREGEAEVVFAPFFGAPRPGFAAGSRTKA